MATSVVESLESIQDAVSSTHWTKQTYHMKKGEKDLYCLVGHVNKVTRTPLWRSSCQPFCLLPLPEKAESHRGMLLSVIFQGIKKTTPLSRAKTIEQWNDAPQRSRQQVIAALDAAIKIAKEL